MLENFIIDIILLVVVLILLIVASVFVTKAAVDVTKMHKWKDNPSLVGAHSWFTRAAVTGWLSSVAVMGLAGLYLFFGLETVEFTGNLVTTGLLFITAGFTLLTGILAAIGTAQLPKSGIDNIKDSDAYHDGLTATILAIIGAVIVMVIFVVRLFYHPGRKKKKEAAKEKEEAKDQEQDALKELLNQRVERSRLENEAREAQILESVGKE